MELINNKEIIKKNLELKKISDKIQRYQKEGISHSTTVMLEADYFKFENELNEAIGVRLELENIEYKELSIENIKLLGNSKLTFKTSKQGISFTGNYVTSMKGRLHSNGHIYCDVEKTSQFEAFAQFSFPCELRGKIDGLGNVRLQTTKINSAFIKKIPLTLVGEIHENGSIIVKTTENEFDYVTGVKHIISRIVSSSLFDNTNNEESFKRNKEKLLIIIEDFKNKIIQ